MKRRYGRAHALVRKKYVPLVEKGGVMCARCGEPIFSHEGWDLDNDDSDPLQRRYLGPSHARCNRATVTHLKAKAEPKVEPARWSRHWYVGSGFDARCPACRERGEACDAARRAR
jgi:hypothetical protein